MEDSGTSRPVEAVEGGGGGGGDDVGRIPDIEIGAIRDAIVSENTQNSYIPEIFRVMMWLRKYEPQVLTDEGKQLLDTFEAKMTEPNQSATKILNKNRNEFILAVRSCDVRPLIHEDLLTPEVYIDYARTIRKVRDPNKMLSKMGYGVKRAALYHFFRCHNGNGYPYQYCKKLTNLFKGFNRVIVTRRRDQAIANVNNTNSSNQQNTTATAPNLSAFSKFFFYFFLFFKFN